MGIKENYKRLRGEIPDYVEIILAAKARTADQIKEAVSAGAGIIGENYVQEGLRVYEELGELARKVKWHFIGHLQKNKINKALQIFDVFQTIDSYEVASALDARAGSLGKRVPVFIEVNIADEPAKSGLKPDYDVIKALAEGISSLANLQLQGLMTMGPLTEEPDELRPYFRKAKEFFSRLKDENLPGADLKYLSMGMSNSYRVAVEEGANMVRIGTAVFGERGYR